MGATRDVIPCHVNFVGGKGVDQPVHPLDGILGIFAFRKTLDQFLEGFKRIARRLGIPFRGVLVGIARDDALILAEPDDSLQVIGVVHVPVGGVQLDEAVRRRRRAERIGVLVIRIGQFELGLLRESSIGEPGLELFVILDGLLVVAAGQFVLGFAVQLVGGPSGGFIRFAHAAGAHEERGDNGHQNRYTWFHTRCVLLDTGNAFK